MAIIGCTNLRLVFDYKGQNRAKNIFLLRLTFSGTVV